MTTIEAYTSDQRLVIAQKMKIGSGDINSVTLAVDFDEFWGEFTSLTACFANSKVEDGKIYEVLMIDKGCTVPHEVLSAVGTLSIGIRGAKPDGSAVKTSTIAKLNIEQGANAATTTISPTKDLYCQYLEALQDTLNPITENVNAQLAAQTAAVNAQLEAQAALLNGDVLWENTDTTAEFAAQTIEMDLSEYKRFAFVVRLNATVDEYAEITISQKDIKQVVLSRRSSYGVTCQRAVKITNNNIEFFTGYSDNDTSNTSCIPVKVIGYKY